ncbi:MAG: hypothetical protein HN427_06550 [Flavobacteriales bacterium]|jgi:hypothetical protein|nr:hypothetical protein [Flavobacteriales bacterium]MBT6013363.1 hypothetical protein [Flavobacteriales bacterium]
MNTENLIFLIENPEKIGNNHLQNLEKITDEFPFFSAPQQLLAKGLLNTESFRYNRQLKRAAVYSANRKLLFKLITENKVVVLENTKTELPKIVKEKTITEEKLEIGKPLEFDETEEHSFSEWLALTKVKKINREEIKENPNDLIDKFIDTKPIMKAEKTKFFSPTETAKTSLIENDELVTETLARVYLEQQHFDKAISAYKKLSLKYPEKSSLFADQINLIIDLKKK